MAFYYFKAVTQEGELREGRMEAADEKAVISQLQSSGLIPISAAEQGSQSVFNTGFDLTLRRRGIGDKQVLAFTQDLSHLLKAGIPLDHVLEIMSRVGRDETLMKLVVQVEEGVRRGQPLSRVLGEMGGQFSKFYINMVQAAEVSGDMASGMTDLAYYLERSRELKGQTMTALLYPLILLGVAAFSLIIILTYVVPQFQQLFEDMGKALPLATRIVIAIADAIRGYGIWGLMAVGLLALYGKRWLADPERRLRWDRLLLKLPLIGPLNQKIEMARFSRSLGTLMKGGVPLLSALAVAKETLINRVLAQAIESAGSGLKEGKRLADPLIESGVFPPLALQMIQVGEETGQLEAMLLKVADVYDREVSTAIQRLLAILEPVLIVGLGILIAGIIMSILVAIISINELPI
jgi:general secretion pathway protein F